MIVRPFLCICLLLITPLLQLQAEVGGVLHLKGSVWTNGTPARDGSAIALGEKVQTGQDSFANLSTRAGDSIVVAGNSTAFYGRDSVRLESGAVVLTGRNVKVEVADMTASSTKNANAQILVHSDSNKIEIAAVKGSVTVRDGGKDTVLPEGKVMTKSRSGASGPSAAVSNFSGSTALVAILTAAAAAGIITGVALYNDDNKTVSPSAP
jgi:hypothetical protein